ncbi:MAG: hypothetical protein ACK44W_00385 [Planctomycetota bacterium]
MGSCLAVLVAALGGLQDNPPGPPSLTKFTASTDDDFHFETDLRDSDVRVSVAHYKVSAELYRMAGPSDHFRLSFAGEFLEYDFAGLRTLLTGAPESFAEEIHAWRLDPSYTHVFDDTWSGVLYGTLAWAYEEEANMGDSAAGAVGAGAFYRAGPDLTLGLALHVQFRIEDHEWIYPLAYIDWKISERASLRTESKAGYGLTFGYALDDARAVTLETRLRYQGRRIRLREENVIPDGILDDQRALLDLGIRWQPVRNVRITLYGGVDVWQKFTFEDETGSDLRELESAPAPFVGLAASWEF